MIHQLLLLSLRNKVLMMLKQISSKNKGRILNAGKYEKGQKAAMRILHAAEGILIDEGYQSLSIRRIASRCGITPGNLQYYFPSKNILLEALLNKIIQGYLEEFETDSRIKFT